MQQFLQRSKEWYKELSTLNIWDTHIEVEQSSLKISIFNPRLSKCSSSPIRLFN